MDEIASYLAAAEKKMKDATADKPKLTYEYAQLLASVGKYDEALIYFREAYQLLTPNKHDYVWKSLYCSVGVQLATVLDYIGRYDDAGEVFKDIMEVEPKGFHIGDYALFLHRRKRDFDKAQK